MLTNTQKLQAYQTVITTCQNCNDDEFCRAAATIGTAWANATDPNVAAAAVITEVNNFRSTNPTPGFPLTEGSLTVVSFKAAEKLAKLALSNI